MLVMVYGHVEYYSIPAGRGRIVRRDLCRVKTEFVTAMAIRVQAKTTEQVLLKGKPIPDCRKSFEDKLD